MTRSLSAIWLAAAIAVPSAASAMEPGTYALAAFAEDTYFAITDLTLPFSQDVIQADLPKAACVRISRLLNAHGGLTACVPVPDTPECAIAHKRPTDENIVACFGPAFPLHD
ncbi:hypothetical protein [Roseibium sp.]|uniref:hypothetical protein n=1 Tax=Roseibium sp. TaxID=1936156 RepID=UPI003BA92268